MKVGGNAAALEYFTRNGGNAYLTPGTEGKVKYTSSTARSYKEELAKKVLEDAKGGPVTSRVAFPGLSLGNSVQAAASVADDTAGKNGGDEDFFDDWDKPAAATPTLETAPAITAATLPSIGRRPSPAATPTATSSGFNTPERSSTPTTTSSRTLNANRGTSSTSTATRKGALGATKVPSSTLGGGSKKLGGVKKATTPFNFEEAERKAKLEEEKAQRMEEEALHEKEGFEQAEAMAKAAIQAATASQTHHEAISVSNGIDPSSPTQPKSPARPSNAKSSVELERLGMGFGKLSMGAARVAAKQERGKASNGNTASTSVEEPNFARSKFAGQKSISSDQYFERGSYDANQTAEARERLQGFSGQTSISSNQYFGREDEEEEGQSRMGPSADGDDWAGDFEQTAREYYSKLMANPDVQSGIESFRAGAMKLSQYLEDMSRNGA
jgi:ADP-ribosylation factor GTPase-activating protein 2/3